MEMKRIRVIIVEDHQLMIDGLKLLLAGQRDIELVGTAHHGREAQTLLRKFHVDVAVVDISMPEMNGEELTRYIRRHHQHVKVLVLSMHRHERYITRMAAAGIDGFMLKDHGETAFVSAIRSVIRDGFFYDQEIAHIMMKRMHEIHHPDHLQTAVQLTRREQDVLGLVGRGLQSKEIADILSIAKSTVETHKLNLREKLGLRDVKALLKYAIENGYAADEP